MAYAQSEILQKEVYLFEQIDRSVQGPVMKHMKCVVFLRPSQENIHLLASELKSPRYGVYYICKLKTAIFVHQSWKIMTCFLQERLQWNHL